MPRHDSLNYAAKWDHIRVVDDSDEESSSGERRQQRPRVTRLDQPSTITIGTPAAAGAAVAKAPQKLSPAVAVKRTDDTVTNHNNTTTTITTAPTASVPSSWTERGAAVILDPSSCSINNKNNSNTDDPTTTRSAGCAGYYWTQDRDTVTIRIPIPNHDNNNNNNKHSSWNCTVQPILSYPDRHCAILSQQPTLVVEYYDRRCQQALDCTAAAAADATTTTTCWLHGTLSRPVHLAQDEDTIDWTIEEEPLLASPSSSRLLRYLCVTLSKATPMPGLTLWWTQCLPQYEPQEIQLTKNNNNKNAQAWSEAWEQAHAQFRAKIRNAENRIPPN